MAVQDNQLCNKVYEQNGVKRSPSDSIVCAGNLIGDDTGCVGDVGD